MKSAKDLRPSHNDDSLRRGSKLDPFNRSGKERHQLYKSLNGNDQEDDEQQYSIPKRESALDYLDQEE